MVTAWASRYAVNTQLNREKPPRSATIDGMAVATMVLSTAAMKMAIKAAARTNPRRDAACAGAPRCVTACPTGAGSGLMDTRRAAIGCCDSNREPGPLGRHHSAPGGFEKLPRRHYQERQVSGDSHPCPEVAEVSRHEVRGARNDGSSQDGSIFRG